jgi:hypothetical protein
MSILIECKASLADLRADKSKPVRKSGLDDSGDPGMGRMRYYMLPKGVAQISDIPAGWGFLEVDGSHVTEIVPSAYRPMTAAGMRRELGLALSVLRRVQDEARRGLSGAGASPNPPDSVCAPGEVRIRSKHETLRAALQAAQKCASETGHEHLVIRVLIEARVNSLGRVLDAGEET